MEKYDLDEQLDTVHCVEEIRRKAISFFEMRAKDRLSEAVADAGIEEPKEKENWVQMWCNSSRHFVGDHSCCIHPKNYDTKRKGRPKLHKDENDNFWIWEEAVEDPTLLEELDLFLESTTPLVEKLKSDNSK